MLGNDSFSTVLTAHELILMEAAVATSLPHPGRIPLHPQLGCTSCVYDRSGRQALNSIYRGFFSIAREGGLPLLITAPTWRANRELVKSSDIPDTVNRDAVEFMQGLRRDLGWNMEHPVLIGGLLGPWGDAYKPELAPGLDEAKEVHAWQAEELAEAGADFLMAATLPAVEEATGLAQAMAKTGMPYIVSFVIDKQGIVLDGNTLAQAIESIDAECSQPPTGFMINCSHPSFFYPEKEPSRVLSRIVGYQANASYLEHRDLDRAEHIQSDDLENWGNRMLELHTRWGLKILGGCCGTGEAHLRFLAQARK